MTNPDEIAFPVVMPSNELYPGLTKRELFAALAMQGAVSNRPVDILCADKLVFCRHCVQWADALIEQLSKEQK